MERRTFIATVASLSTATIAGCTSEGETDEASGSNNQNDDDEASGGSSDDTPEPTDTATPTEDTPPVTILDHELVEGPTGNAEVAGTVQNTSGEEQSYIGVEAKFFDADDTRVGDTMWNAEDVGADRKVEFETAMSTTPMDDVESYELEASTSAF